MKNQPDEIYGRRALDLVPTYRSDVADADKVRDALRELTEIYPIIPLQGAAENIIATAIHNAVVKLKESLNV